MGAHILAAKVVWDMSKIEDLVLQIVRYAEQVKDAVDSEARYNAAFELKLTAADLESAVRSKQ